MKKVLCLVCLATLCACNFGNVSEPAHFYTITTPEVQQIRGPKKSVNIVIENVSVPQSVDRPQIVVKQADSNMVYMSEFDRWVEGLNSALPVAVSENMNMYAKNINARPSRNSRISGKTNYVVSIDFVRFDATSDGDIKLAAWWTVSNNRSEVLIQKKTTLTATVPGTSDADDIEYNAIVAEQSKLIAKLSYKIADAISELK